MSAMQYNGGAVVAMAGKGCVAIACDKRFGQQGLTIGTEFPKIFEMQEKLFIGIAGLATDVQTLAKRFKMKINMYHMNEEKQIKTKKFTEMVSSTLYESRFSPMHVEPVIAGLDQQADGTYVPFIASTDVIGCINFAKDFVVCGTTGPNLYGMCEALWEPELEAEDLFETISQAMLNALDRDALSGWGAIVHIITPTEIITRDLKGRMD